MSVVGSPVTAPPTVPRAQHDAAVADLVVASADPFAGTRLQDATDAVHGLAQGLREVR